MILILIFISAIYIWILKDFRTVTLRTDTTDWLTDTPTHRDASHLKRSSKHIFPFSYYPVKNWHIYLTLVVCTFTLPWTWSECTANVDYYYQGDIHYPHYIYPCNLPKFQCFLSVSHSILTLMWSQLYNLNIHMLQNQIILINNNQPWSVDGVSMVVEPSKCFWK